MSYEEVDLKKTAIRGNLRQARRLVNCEEDAPKLKKQKNRSLRQAIKIALRTGNGRQVERFQPGTSWDLC